MPTVIPIPRDIRNDVQRLRELLQAVVRRSPLGEPQIEQEAGMDEGALKILLSGRAELRVSHLYRVLKAAGTEPLSFFLELRAADETEGRHDAA